MEVVSAANMLSVWEAGLNQTSLQRALYLLAATEPNFNVAELAELTIGERDLRLLQLRQACFGSQLLNSAVCSACGERVEWENNLSDFCVTEISNIKICNLEIHKTNIHKSEIYNSAAYNREKYKKETCNSSLDKSEIDDKNIYKSEIYNDGLCKESVSQSVPNKNAIFEGDNPEELVQKKSKPNEFSFCSGGFKIYFRLPTSVDIAHTLARDDAQLALLERCIVRVEHAAKACTVNQLPEAVLQAACEQIAAADPQAEIRINLQCPVCNHSWSVLFDIASFLWQELHEWAQHMLHTIHKLALGYGWSEQQILNLSPVRRQLYLGMLDQGMVE